MGGEWKTVPAEEFCASVRDGTHDSPKPAENGRPLVTSRHITGNRLNLARAYTISQEDFDEINKRSKVDQWDVLLTMIGTVGEPCLISEPPDFAIKNIGLFKSEGELEGRWLYYYLLSPAAQHHIHAHSRGSTQQYIPLGELRKMPVPFPLDKKEMEAIVHILGSLDGKIELNRKINETLEEMARAIFKSWFVDFDPVRAKAEGRKPEGMDDTTAAFFPESFEDSKLGAVPKGWSIEMLYDTATYTNGSAFKQKDFCETHCGYPVVKIAEIKNGFSAQTKYSNKDIDSKYFIQDGEILFSWSGSPDTSIDTFLWSNGKGLLNQHIFKVVTGELTRSFQYFMLRYLRPVFIEIARDKQTTGLGHVTVKDMKQLPVVIPSQKVLEAFYRTSDHIMEQLLMLALECKNLVSLRDTLLPKLLSCELRIKDAEKFLENVA